MYRVYHKAPDTGRILSKEYDADSPDEAINKAKEDIVQSIHRGEEDELTVEQIREAVDKLFHLVRVVRSCETDGQHRRLN